MALTIVTQPAIEPLDLDEVKDHLRLSETSGNDEDTTIMAFLTAARRYCEAFQNRAYLEQTWKLTLERFPSEAWITLPRPPLMSVTSVKYYGTGGTATTMTAGNYYADTASEPGKLRLGYGESWPSAVLRPGVGVEVEYVAGYGSAASSVPAEITQAIKLVVGHMYEHRENDDVGHRHPDWVKNAFVGADSLLTLNRVWPV